MLPLWSDINLFNVSLQIASSGIAQPTWTENCYHLLKKSLHTKKIPTWSRYTDKSTTLIIRVSVLLSASFCYASCTSQCMWLTCILKFLFFWWPTWLWIQNKLKTLFSVVCTGLLCLMCNFSFLNIFGLLFWKLGYDFLNLDDKILIRAFPSRFCKMVVFKFIDDTSF